MAFFKFRKGADDSPRPSGPQPSIEAIRQRAKYRLAGATVLVLVAVIGLPLLFDKQPRPIAVDTPIVIPDKNKVTPLVIPPSPVKSASTDTAAPAAAVVADQPEPVTEPAPAVVDKPVVAEKPAPAPHPAAATAPKPAVAKLIEEKKPPAHADKEHVATNSIAKEASVSAKPAASKPDSNKPDANRALALLEGKADTKSTNKPTDAAAKPTKVTTPAAGSTKPDSVGEGRFVVQIGAFADNARAHEARVKLENAGIKTYVQAADTKDGRRIRVRAGPFASKAEADKVADKIKKLNLPAALLTL